MVLGVLRRHDLFGAALVKPWTPDSPLTDDDIARMITGVGYTPLVQRLAIEIQNERKARLERLVMIDDLRASLREIRAMLKISD